MQSKNKQDEWAHVRGEGESSACGEGGQLVMAMLTSQGEQGPTDSLSGASSAQYKGD